MGSGIFNRNSTIKRTLNHRYGQFGLLIMRSTRCSCIAFFVFGWEERPTQDTLLWAEGLSGTSLRCDLLSLGSRKEKEQHVFTAKASARYSRKRPDNKKATPRKERLHKLRTSLQMFAICCHLFKGRREDFSSHPGLDTIGNYP